MGSSQSTKRPWEKFLACGSYGYAPISSSSLREPLVDHDSLNTCDCFEQYETRLKDMLRKNTDSENKVAELQRNIQYMGNLQLSHSTAMDGRIKENEATVKKVKELEKEIEHLHHVENSLVSKNAALDKSIEENTATKKKVTELQLKMGHLHHVQISKNAALEKSMEENTASKKTINELQQKIELLSSFVPEVDKHEGAKVTNSTRVLKLEQEIQRLESCLLANNKENTSIIKKFAELEQKIKQLELQISKNSVAESDIMDNTEMELDKDAVEPEYVQRIMDVVMILIIIVAVSIGMQL